MPIRPSPQHAHSNTSASDSYALSAWPANRSDIDDSVTLNDAHGDGPHNFNSSRTNLVGKHDMAYNSANASEDEHAVQTPKAKRFTQSAEKRPHSSRNPSWDMLGGVNEGAHGSLACIFGGY
jgi:hypothetical protein